MPVKSAQVDQPVFFQGLPTHHDGHWCFFPSPDRCTSANLSVPASPLSGASLYLRILSNDSLSEGASFLQAGPLLVPPTIRDAHKAVTHPDCRSCKTSCKGATITCLTDLLHGDDPPA